MAANVSHEKLRREILCSPARRFVDFRLAYDCCTPNCWGERTIGLAAIIGRCGEDILVAHVVNRLRCTTCRRPPQVVHLETGPRINARPGGWHRTSLRALQLPR